VVPELKVTAPLTLAEAAFAEAIVTEPEEEDVLAPLVTDTLPPGALPVDAPADTRSAPPVFPEEPALIETLPPLPDVPLPTVMLIGLPLPAVEVPVSKVRKPELPDAAVPVLSVRDPLIPAVAASEEAMVTEPVEEAVLLPLFTVTAPPVTEDDDPADRTNAPPAELVLDGPA